MIRRQFLRTALCALLALPPLAVHSGTPATTTEPTSETVSPPPPAPAAATAVPTASPAPSPSPSQAPTRKPDLADFVAGEYFGDVTSDSRGSSRTGVSLTLTRIGPNRVQITSDYPRLPVVEVSVMQAMQSIIAADGNTVFVIDRAKDASRLGLTFNHEVSWSGTKQ